MRVSKWGNNLAVSVPAEIVEALDLKEGDQIEIRVACGIRRQALFILNCAGRPSHHQPVSPVFDNPVKEL